MHEDLFRVYLDPADLAMDGYPMAWHGMIATASGRRVRWHGPTIKDLVREAAGHRCVRCGHPYRKGDHGNGEWSSCDETCTHAGTVRLGPDPWTRHTLDPFAGRTLDLARDATYVPASVVEAQWRILTVHHLNGVKHDCRWWNLVALCQRCHLSIQTRVVMDREYVREHSDWFKPYVAGFYAWKYLGEEVTREQALERMDELLALEQRQDRLPL